MSDSNWDGKDSKHRLLHIKPKCDLNLSSSGTYQCLTAFSLVLVFLSKGKQILLAQLISVLYVFWIPLKWLLILSLLGSSYTFDCCYT